MSALSIERVDVADSALTATVRVREGAPLSTAEVPGLAERALELLPGMRRHRCENGTARGMARELADTETAHLLEHVALELMALSGSPRDTKAETSWDFAKDGRGVFRVTLGFDDDLVALGALRAGVGVVGWLLDPESAPRPDIDAAVALLRTVRRVP